MRAVQRIALLGLALSLVALLVTARILTPDDRGYGTHQQLGLQPCTFQLIFHRPCPACGMTTAWSWLLRGRIGRAMAVNAGGAMLAGLSVVAAAWLLASGVRGRWLVGRPGEWIIAGIAGAIGLVTAGQWIWRFFVL
jgi:hypothetical protein